ncbi:ATP-dependent DNA/RNA helicase DHX36-like [Leguminivora glycinivorella]|uniref:ATP-dependent DNA/RNA helicase DHX36-like n=1 Tax=Leguminivora glycinivorella TaxID=1035111 RepID=UPI00200DBFA7|nr:ATP-dependent DNA/RNA helicase DHX36-like [Leguminivora glycinivorella]XP_047992892.1 ATP-dependent DNA/RNA helicase DHX36-like [Leguminivora glycinivorella]
MGKKNKQMRMEAKIKKVKNKLKKVKGQGRRGRYFSLFDSKNEEDDPQKQDLPSSGTRNSVKGNSNIKKTLPQVVLDIPLVVIAQVVSDIKEIEKLAEKETIHLNTAQSFQRKTLSQPASQDPPPSGWMLGGYKRTPVNTSDFIPIQTKRQKNSNHGKSKWPARSHTPIETKLKPAPVESLDFISFNSDNECKSQAKQTGIKVPAAKCSDYIYFKTEHNYEMERNVKPTPVESLDFISFKSEAKCKSYSESQLPKETGTKTPPAKSSDFSSFKTETSEVPITKIENNGDSDHDSEPSPSTSKCTNDDITTKVIKTKADFSDERIKELVPKHENEDIKTDIILIESDSDSDEVKCLPKREPIRGGEHYKYGYKDIITGTFEEKLDESLAKNESICTKTKGNDCLSIALHEEFQDMITRPQFKDMMVFRERLPAFRRSAELLDVLNNNQVVVISGETGCGKSTQVPQIILDNALCQNQGAYIHILVTQPRRIAASSLASRVAQERAEKLGNSVGYAVRLEKSDCRPRGSIKYVTTGILLADLEVNQGLTNFSHIILDEAHERDSHLDLSMCVLKQVLENRNDLQLILMSATMDTQRLSTYFDDCPVIHIEGLSYPVKDFYIEDILTMTGYRIPPVQGVTNDEDRNGNETTGGLSKQEKDRMYKAKIDPWLKSFNGRLDKDVYTTLQDRRIEKLNFNLIIALLVHISRGPPGAVLVFLPGIHEIFKLMRMINESEMFPQSNYHIYPLHSKLPTIEQHKIFKRPPRHIRKIIIATNIAETSITIDDIVYVVDCGRVKMKGMDVEHNISTLETEFESKANLMQRRGRAGRCQPGIAYHLMTSYRSQNIPERLLPELQRCNLLEAVLEIKKLRLGNAIDAFQLVPDPPANVTVENAVRHLQKLGALNGEEQLTPLGWHLARLPVHPAAGKLLLFGALFGCLDRAASVAAVWGFKDPFKLILDKEYEINQAKRKLALGEPSDHVAISEGIIQWEQLDRENQSQFAQEHFLSENTLKLLSQMKCQLCGNLRRMGFLASKNVRLSWENRNADNLYIFKAIVAAALYPNIAIVRWTNLHNPEKQTILNILTPEDGRVQLHPSSMMFVPQRGPMVPLCNKPGANWLVYWMKQKSSELFLFDVTLVFTLPLLLFGELAVSEVKDSPEECYLSASTVKVCCLKGTADVIFRLRNLLDQVLASMVEETSDRSTRYSEFDNLVFKAVIDLMTLEDERPEGLEDEFSESDSSDCEVVCDMKPEDRYPVIVID